MNEDLSNQNQLSKFGWVQIEISKQGCFSGNGQSIEFSFDDSEECLIEVTFNEKKNDFSIEKSEAEEFLKKIIYLGKKPEVLSESGWTTSRHVKVEWQNLAFAEEAEGKISAISNEWTIEEIEELLPKVKDAAIVEKIKETLAKGLHRRAIEISLETETFIKKHLPASAKT